ncbi:MAG: DUF1223 domain-containing protein [Hyphomicrobiaceae bacterium]
MARSCTGLVAMLVLMAAMVPGQADQLSPPAVVELFTSQGCSSCPAADEILGELAKRQDVIALSLPVDYWDYLGWRDTLASHEFTERQRSYALARGDGQVYTPQVVVNGLVHAVGSRLADIEAAMAATEAKLGTRRTSIALRMEADDIVVDIGAATDAADPAEGRILLAMTTRSVEVPIARGENRGRTITYYNVVRKLTEIGRWTGAAQSIHVSKSEYAGAESDGCVVLLQTGAVGPIVAAAQLADF